MDEQEIRSILSDDEKIIAQIKKRPQTYNSILSEFKDCGTFQVILRRRIKRLLKEQQIWKMCVPGTRYGLVLFCTPERDYKIIVFQGVSKVRVFYMYEFNENDSEVNIEKYWELLGPNWSRWVYSEEKISMPKYMMRDGGFRIWE